MDVVQVAGCVWRGGMEGWAGGVEWGQGVRQAVGWGWVGRWGHRVKGVGLGGVGLGEGREKGGEREGLTWCGRRGNL